MYQSPMEKVKLERIIEPNKLIPVSISYGESKTRAVAKWCENNLGYQSPMEKVKPVYLTGSV